MDNTYIDPRRKQGTAWKKQLGWRRGLRFFSKTNDQGWIIASRHWPHIIVWSWALYYYPPQHRSRWKQRPGYHKYVTNVGGNWFLGLSVLGQFRFAWQDDWMISDDYYKPAGVTVQ